MRARWSYLTKRTNALLEWLRLPGDVVFIAGGAVPVLYLAWLGVRHMKPGVTRDDAAAQLFTEVIETGVQRP